MAAIPSLSSAGNARALTDAQQALLTRLLAYSPDDPHAFFGVDRRGFEVEAGETVEIDSRRDLYVAEAVLRDRQAAGGGREAA